MKIQQRLNDIKDSFRGIQKDPTSLFPTLLTFKDKHLPGKRSYHEEGFAVLEKPLFPLLFVITTAKITDMIPATKSKVTHLLLIPPLLLAACTSSPGLQNNNDARPPGPTPDVLASNYARQFGKHEFSFPRDHAAHPEYRREWWYFTGNVQSGEDRRIGYELTIFRFAPKPLEREHAAPNHIVSNKTNVPDNAASYRANHTYMAHLAVTDIDNNKFYYAEQFNRDAIGLAGADLIYSDRPEGSSAKLKVWLKDWAIESVGDSVFPIKLIAQEDNFGISLVLEQTRPIVLQGGKGLHVKGDNPGNASCYYSITKMATTGSVTINNKQTTVSGYSWFDREWSTSHLEPEQAGWDWFALQLTDNREIMFYSLRRKSGEMDMRSVGSITEEDGASRKLAADDITIDVINSWTSPHTNTTYPSGWNINIPSESLELQVTPAVKDQELNTTIRYWEGSVEVSGKYKNNNRIVAGRGYVELVGYEPD